MSADGLPVGSPALPTDHTRADWVENITNELMFGVKSTRPEGNATRLARARAEVAATAARLDRNARSEAEDPDWRLSVIEVGHPSLRPSEVATNVIAADGDIFRAIDATFRDNPAAATQAKDWVAFQTSELDAIEYDVRGMLLGVPGFTPEANRLRTHKADQELTEMQERDEEVRVTYDRFARTGASPEEVRAYRDSASILVKSEPGRWHVPLTVDGNVISLVAKEFAPKTPDEVEYLTAARKFLTQLGADPALISEQTRELTEPHIELLTLGVNGTTPEANAARLARAEAVIRDVELNPPDPQDPWTKDRVPVESIHYPLRDAGGDVLAAFNATNHDPVAQDMAARVLSEHEARAAERAVAQPRHWWQRKPKADVVEAQRQDQGSAGRRARMDRVLSDAEQPVSSQVPDHFAPRVERGRQL